MSGVMTFGPASYEVTFDVSRLIFGEPFCFMDNEERGAFMWLACAAHGEGLRYDPDRFADRLMVSRERFAEMWKNLEPAFEIRGGRMWPKWPQVEKKRLPVAPNLRAAIIRRDGLVCGLCGGDVEPDDVHVDHIVPVARGGRTEAENLRVAHSSCNMGKGSRV